MGVCGEKSGEGAFPLLGLGRTSGKSGNLCGGRPNVSLLAVQRECGVAEDKKSDQCAFLAEAMTLIYVLLELFTLLQLKRDRSRRDILANL